MDFGALAHQMTDQLHQNVRSNLVLSSDHFSCLTRYTIGGLWWWILPDFTTTTLNDTIISSVLMMSTLKTYAHQIRRHHRITLKYFSVYISYFNYKMSLLCGIPSVTLEGEKSDWELLLARADKLDSFGEEPKAWAVLLRPILTRFVRAFDGKPNVDFWSRVSHYF